ncbi:MAG: hypothetical protein R3C17_17680 [Planctomycetaceae bacterium]
MSPDKYQQAWKAEASQVKVTFDANLLSKEVWKSRENFRSLIFWRDVREVGTSLVMIPVWFVMGNFIPVPWTWWLSVPAFFWIAGFILVDRKRHPQAPSGPGEPLLFYVNESLTQIEHQIWLLRNVFWWYELPPSVSMMAFFLHVAWNSSSTWWEFVLVAGGCGLFLFVIYGFIYWINQSVVRNQLEPRRQHLMKLVANLEGENAAADSADIMELVSSLAGTDQNAGLSANWATWSQNWNRIIPSWREVPYILVPTLAGAYCGFRYSMPEAGPVFFQSVVAAVIPFEIMFFGLWYLSYRRHKGQPLTATGTVRPNAPAIVILVMILLMSALAFAAVFSFVNGAGSRSGNAHNTSPFTEVNFEGEQVIVTCDGTAYQWLEIDEIKVEDIVASAKKQFGGAWQKRIREDLVEVLWGMGHKPGSTVKLHLQDFKTKKDIVFEKAPMTKANRDAIKAESDASGSNEIAERVDGDVTVDAKTRARLVGRYTLANFNFDVEDRDGHLMVRLSGQQFNEVFPDSETTWSYRGIDAMIEFKLGRSGPASQLTLHQNGIKQVARRIKK